MYQLTLIRHAKSSWEEAGQKDFDRPLNARGKRDAPLRAQWAAQHLLKPGLLVSSPALLA